jgi:hypothetical protein
MTRVAGILAAMILATPSVAAGGRWQGLDVGDARPNTVHETSVVQLAREERVEWKTFRAAKLGFQFSYPNNRKVTVGCHVSKHCVALVGKTSRPGDYLLAIEVFEGSLDAVATEQAIFRKDGDNWIAHGRTGEYPIEPLSGPDWQGLKSIVDCGISESGGGLHGSAGECLWVVLSNGKRSVVVDTQGTAAIDQDIMRSVLSIRFSGS